MRRCLDVLNKYDVCFIAPKSLDLENYKKILNEYNKKFRAELFDDSNFSSLKNYSRLMLKKDVYEPFLDYEKMLIYQLDAWIFKDELEYWCKEPYDYIGAPWFEGWADNVKVDTPLQKFAGNGGFSLRSVDKMYKLVSSKIKGHLSLKEVYEIYKKNHLISNILTTPIFIIKWIFQKERFLNYFETTDFYEDVAINKIVQRKNLDWFRLAPCEKALKFSFEVQPKVLFEKNNNNLPFGCHAFLKYDWEFFKKYIKESN